MRDFPAREGVGQRVVDQLVVLSSPQESPGVLADARVKVHQWRRDYNERRPHSRIGRVPPAVFARTNGARQDVETARPYEASPPGGRRNPERNGPVKEVASDQGSRLQKRRLASAFACSDSSSVTGRRLDVNAAPRPCVCTRHRGIGRRSKGCKRGTWVQQGEAVGPDAKNLL